MVLYARWRPADWIPSKGERLPLTQLYLRTDAGRIFLALLGSDEEVVQADAVRLFLERLIVVRTAEHTTALRQREQARNNDRRDDAAARLARLDRLLAAATRAHREMKRMQDSETER